MNNFFSRFPLSLILILTLTLLLPAAPFAADDPVVAEIGKEKITLSQFQQELDNLPPNLQQMTRDPKIRQDFLEQLATSHLLYQEGLSRGIDQEPEVKRQIDETVRKIVLGNLLQREIEGRIKAPGADEVSQYYQTHADEFSTEAQVRARHILVKDESEAQALAAELAKGSDFTELAKQKSTCSSAASGGDLGFFTRERMVKEFADAAFALQPGEISAPVKTKFGYHLIKLEEVRAAGTRPLEEVRTAIENKLTQEKKSEIFNEYVAGLKKKSSIKLYPEVLEKN